MLALPFAENVAVEEVFANARLEIEISLYAFVARNTLYASLIVTFSRSSTTFAPSAPVSVNAA